MRRVAPPPPVNQTWPHTSSGTRTHPSAVVSVGNHEAEIEEAAAFQTAGDQTLSLAISQSGTDSRREREGIGGREPEVKLRRA